MLKGTFLNKGDNWRGLMAFFNGFRKISFSTSTVLDRIIKLHANNIKLDEDRSSRMCYCLAFLSGGVGGTAVWERDVVL